MRWAWPDFHSTVLLLVSRYICLFRSKDHPLAAVVAHPEPCVPRRGATYTYLFGHKLSDHFGGVLGNITRRTRNSIQPAAHRPFCTPSRLNCPQQLSTESPFRLSSSTLWNWAVADHWLNPRKERRHFIARHEPFQSPLTCSQLTCYGTPTRGHLCAVVTMSVALSGPERSMASQAAALTPGRTALPSRPPRESGSNHGRARQVSADVSAQNAIEPRSNRGSVPVLLPRPPSLSPVPVEVRRNPSPSQGLVETSPVQGQSGQVCR